MRYLTLAATLLTAAVAAPAFAQDAPDPAKVFARMDTDKSGDVSKAEWLAAGRKEAGFARIDANSDGKITLDEMKAAIAARAKKAE